MLVEGITLIASLILLARASEHIIEHAVVLSKYFRIGEAVFGFIFIALSTSMSELAVSLTSSFLNEGAIAVGNVIGSNIITLTMVLGICALIKKIRVDESEMPVLARVLFVLSILSVAIAFLRGIGRIEGIFLILAFIVYILVLIKTRPHILHSEGVTKHDAMHSFSWFIIDFIILFLASRIVVSSAIYLSDVFSLSRTFIGATIVALGTALPELAVDTAAVRKGKYSLALGDIFGSMMVNLTLVLGLSLLLSPAYVEISVFSVLLLFLALATMFVFFRMETRKFFDSSDGMVLIFFYMIFMMVMFAIEFLYDNRIIAGPL